MPFKFKQRSRDFYVTEELPFIPSGKGDALYIFFEKRNQTTHEVLQYLCQKFSISRKTLGIAGLKDKKAVAKQRITIYKSALDRLGGEKEFIKALGQKVKILEITKHERPIGMSTPIRNTFHIRFRPTQQLNQSKKQESLATVERLLKEGYPNSFGDQRFGINGKNRKQGQQIMLGKSTLNLKKGEKIFKLQAFSSKIFNDYIKKRAQRGLKILDGDILSREENGHIIYGNYNKETNTANTRASEQKRSDHFYIPHNTQRVTPYNPTTMNITGPVPGFNTPLASSQAGVFEKSFLERHHLDPVSMKVYKEEKVYGLRRALWVQPTHYKARYQQDDLLIDFTLPAGSYASIIYDILMKTLGE